MENRVAVGRELSRALQKQLFICQQSLHSFSIIITIHHQFPFQNHVPQIFTHSRLFGNFMESQATISTDQSKHYVIVIHIRNCCWLIFFPILNACTIHSAVYDCAW